MEDKQTREGPDVDCTRCPPLPQPHLCCADLFPPGFDGFSTHALEHVNFSSCPQARLCGDKGCLWELAVRLYTAQWCRRVDHSSLGKQLREASLTPQKSWQKGAQFVLDNASCIIHPWAFFPSSTCPVLPRLESRSCRNYLLILQSVLNGTQTKMLLVRAMKSHRVRTTKENPGTFLCRQDLLQTFVLCLC